MPRGRPTRRQPPPAARGALPFVEEQQRATAYVGRWHVTRDWAVSALEPRDVDTRERSRDPRVSTVRGAMVRDLDDDEEAYQRGQPLEELDFEYGPKSDVAGRRRIIIRALTWEIDYDAEIAHHPQWLVLGRGFSPRAASAWLRRYVQAYADAVDEGLESRRLIVTVLDVQWWTAAWGTDYV